jgi:hypothetical protein
MCPFPPGLHLLDGLMPAAHQRHTRFALLYTVFAQAVRLIFPWFPPGFPLILVCFTPALQGEEELELMYDPILNCYYDPLTNKYYELKNP